MKEKEVNKETLHAIGSSLSMVSLELEAIDIKVIKKFHEWPGQFWCYFV